MPKVEGMPEHFMCKDCRVVKHNDDYYKDKSNYRGLSDRCKSCAKKNTLKYKRKKWRQYLDRQIELRQKLKDEVYSHLGTECACCGETEKEFLAIDHVRGDGAADRKAKGTMGGEVMYRAIRKEGYPKDKYQILCHNCNWSKGSGPEGMCVHQRNKSKVL